MRRRHTALAFVLLLLAAGTLPAMAGGNANFLLGNRIAGDKDFWGSRQDQMVAGILVDFGKEGWPIHLCLASMGSSSEENGITGSVDEYALGVMKVWEPRSAIRPFVGAGLAAVTVSFITDTGSGDLVRHDTTSAFYVDGGVFWRTGRRFNIGAGVRFMTQARIEIQGVRGDANYSQFHVLAGWGWPRREKGTDAASPPGGAP
jgi:hypothetical protein